ncbi:MAG: FtsX-like permease family protein [Chloroflexi bacterium]|nr:FtsX-like permease family protein [Chloroflexota bacterium]
MVPLARRYLLSDRLRLAISAGGVAFAVLLIVLILALYQGIYDRAGRLATTPPTQLWVTQAGTPDPSHGASILPESVLAQVQAVPGVRAVQPLLARTMLLGGQPNSGTFTFVMALPQGPLQAATAEAFGLRSLPGKGEAVLSDLVADDIGAGRGDTIYVGTSSFRVAEVSSLVDAGFSSAAFIGSEDAPELFGHPHAFSFGLVTVDEDAEVEEVEDAIEREVPGTNALTREEFADATRREVEEGFLPVVAVLIGVAYVVGLAVIALTIYTSTVERIRDYGVLKAVGASPLQLFAVVIRQSVVIALIGYVAGSALGYVSGNFIQDAVPEFATIYRWQDLAAVFGAALVMSAAATLVPIRRVAGIDPAVVFRA